MGSPATAESDLPLCDVIRGRSVTLGERAYVEHARDGRALSFRQLERSMERWRALLGGARAGGLTTIGLAISDPMAFTDAFLGAIAAGFWVAPLDPVPALGRERAASPQPCRVPERMSWWRIGLPRPTWATNWVELGASTTWRAAR